MIDAANDVGNADAFDACAVEESAATAPGLDIYIVFDRSGNYDLVLVVLAGVLLVSALISLALPAGREVNPQAAPGG